MITFNTCKHHWNYCLTVEKDLENLSRYVEFTEDNLEVYSIELTRILLSSSSEVDVVMKQLCKLLDPDKEYENINDYKAVIKNNLPLLIDEEITIDRFGFSFKPWNSWTGEQNPCWWKSYNNVKHKRNSHFSEANLDNALNSVGALLLANVYYYKYFFSKEANKNFDMKDVTIKLRPGASLMKINADYYHKNLMSR